MRQPVNTHHQGRRRHSGHWLRLALALLVSLCATTRAGPTTAPAATSFVVRGLWHREYRIDEALARATLPLVEEGWVYDGTGSGWPGPGDQGAGGLTEFPSPGQLARCRAVVVIDTNAKALGAHAEALGEYVRGGGGLVLLGGRFAFGKQYRQSPLAALCPVEFLPGGPWDSGLVNRTDGWPFAAGPDPLPGLPSLPTAAPPRVFWLHDVKPKPEAQVHLVADGRPLLVSWAVGKGRVVLFAGTVLGDPPAGTPPFWEMDEWPRTLAAVIAWAARTDAPPAPPTLPAALRERLEALTGPGGGGALEDEAAGHALGPLLTDAARLHPGPADLLLLLRAAAALPGDLSPDATEALTAAADAAPPAESADTRRRLLASGLPHKVALGAAVPLAAPTPDDCRALQELYRSGTAPAAAADPTAELDDTDADSGDLPKVELVSAQDQMRHVTAIRLGALAGLGRTGLPANQEFLRATVAALAATGAPKPREYADVITDENRLYQQALLAGLRCGDAQAAGPLVAALMENVYALIRARMEANKPKDRLQRVQAAYGPGVVRQRELCRQLTQVPDSVLPALAARVAAETDRRVFPLALATFAGRTLPAEAAAALARSPVPEVRALAP